MMRKARRYHAVRGAVSSLSAGAGDLRLGRLREVEEHAESDPCRRTGAEPAQCRHDASAETSSRKWLRIATGRSAACVKRDKARHSPGKQLHASLALLPVDSGQVDYLYDRLLDAQPHEVPVIRDALAPHKDGLLDKLWAVVASTGKGQGIATAASGGGVGEVRRGEREVGDGSRGRRQRSGGCACVAFVLVDGSAASRANEVAARNCRLSIEIPVAGKPSDPWQPTSWPTTLPTIRKCWPIC